jgi:hypothetical protein
LLSCSLFNPLPARDDLDEKDSDEEEQDNDEEQEVEDEESEDEDVLDEDFLVSFLSVAETLPLVVSDNVKNLSLSNHFHKIGLF